MSCLAVGPLSLELVVFLVANCFSFFEKKARHGCCCCCCQGSLSLVQHVFGTIKLFK
jgi:hypothetical protein